MLSWLESYAKTHLFYIILIVGGAFAFRVWLQEHDARVAADNTVKQQVAVVNELKTQIEATQVQAAQQVKVVKQVVAKASTPSDVVAILPTLTPFPLNTRPVPPSPIDVQVEGLPLLQLAGDDKETHIELEACQQVGELKDKQLTAKDAEITALKKKPRFFRRVVGVAKAVGVGVGIGLLLTHL